MLKQSPKHDKHSLPARGTRKRDRYAFPTSGTLGTGTNGGNKWRILGGQVERHAEFGLNNFALTTDLVSACYDIFPVCIEKNFGILRASFLLYCEDHQKEHNR